MQYGSMTKPTLKKRSGQSSWRAFASSHDGEAEPFLRELAEAVGFGTGNIDRAGMREFLVIEVENLVVEALQRAFGNRDQANRNVEVGQPIRRVGEAFEMFEIFFDFGATAHAPKGRRINPTALYGSIIYACLPSAPAMEGRIKFSTASLA